MKKKSPKIIECVNTGIFSANIMFICGFTYKETIAELKKQKANDWIIGLEKAAEIFAQNKPCAISQEVEYNDGEKTCLYYIWLPERFDFSKDNDYITLAHEVLHICQMVLPRFLNRDREYECEAYLHSHIMKQCLNALR